MKKFNILVIDPPYAFSDKLNNSDVKRGAEANYSTLTFDDLLALPIKEISAKPAILALWVPSTLIAQGLKLMEAYGFQYKQIYVWAKTKKDKSIINFLKKEAKKLFTNFTIDSSILSFGMGRLFRQSHEIALIGINSSEIYKLLSNKSQRSVSFAPNLGHSTKPELLQDQLELMFPSFTNKIEIFARRERNGWTCLGNQVGIKEDIRNSLQKLINTE